MESKFVIIIGAFLMGFTCNVLGQKEDKKLQFVLLIDNDVPTPSGISEGRFIKKDSIGNVTDSIPFNYEVGSLAMSSDNYKRLFSYKNTSGLFIKFKQFEFTQNGSEIRHYEKAIPAGSINAWYMIFKIHNYSLRESKKRYTTDSDGYGVQIKFPGGGAAYPYANSNANILLTKPAGYSFSKRSLSQRISIRLEKGSATYILFRTMCYKKIHKPIYH